jgi:hypothetical protein
VADESGPEWLAVVCAHLEEIRADLRGGPGGDAGPVERVLSAVRDGSDPEAALTALHAVLQAGGDPLGLDGYGGPPGGLRGLPGLRAEGINAPHAEWVYLCPTGRCPRHAWPAAAAPQPRCAIRGTELRLERL